MENRVGRNFHVQIRAVDPDISKGSEQLEYFRITDGLSPGETQHEEREAERGQGYPRGDSYARKKTSRSISRVLSGHANVSGQSFIYGSRHREPSAAYPNPVRTTPWDSYLALLQAGFT